jgi:GntR family transcriptional regulator
VIEFHVDRADGLPAYLQLERQVREALRLGWLHPGDRLPTVREVVASSGVNANTVLKAYRELDVAGLVEARQGSGTFVTGSLGSADPAAMAELRVGLARWVHIAKEAGLDNEDIRALLGAVLTERGNLQTEGVQ